MLVRCVIFVIVVAPLSSCSDGEPEVDWQEVEAALGLSEESDARCQNLEQLRQVIESGGAVTWGRATVFRAMELDESNFSLGPCDTLEQNPTFVEIYPIESWPSGWGFPDGTWLWVGPVEGFFPSAWEYVAVAYWPSTRLPTLEDYEVYFALGGYEFGENCTRAEIAAGLEGVVQRSGTATVSWDPFLVDRNDSTDGCN